jgi:hypothetical protein
MIECTTCRTEGGYSDGRHPDAVAFTGLIEDDLSRRDFTVNAMAFTHAEGGLSVLDLFGGSGTTIMACEQNGRRGFSMEFDPRYAQTIIQRWETFTGEKAVLLND